MTKQEILKKIDELRGGIADTPAGQALSTLVDEIELAVIEDLVDAKEFDELEQKADRLDRDNDELSDKIDELESDVAFENERPYVNHLLDGKSPMSWLTDPERNR